MLSNAEKVKAWRKRTKKRIVACLGGGCVVCGLSEPDEVFDVHHLFPEEKKFKFGSLRANSRSWKSVVPELRKCVLLCANCHRLHHCGYLEIPEDAPRFDERYVDYKRLEKENASVA